MIIDHIIPISLKLLLDFKKYIVTATIDQACISFNNVMIITLYI